MAPATRRLVVGAVVGSAIGAAILGRPAMPLALGIALTALAWGGWTTWERRRRWRSIPAEIRLRWLELPGAAVEPEGLIHVHHGTQPLWIRLHPHNRVTVATRVGEMPVAFRIWPWKHPPPALTLEDAAVGEPDLDPAPLLEDALGGLLHIESNDANALARLLDPDVTAPLLAAGESAAGSFAGLTYNGHHLMIHLAGPMAADPPRATHLARLLWEPWMP